MSVNLALFRGLKSIFPSDFRGTFASQKLTEKNTYGVFFKGGTPSGRTVDSGRYKIHKKMVVLNIQSDESVQSIIKGLEFGESCFSALEGLNALKYVDSETGQEVVLLSAEILGDINQIGVNSFNIPSFSLNFILNYAIGGVNHG